MPDNIPVRVGGFVKKNAAHRKAVVAKNRTDQSAYHRRLGKRSHFGNVQQIADSVNAFPPPDTLSAADGLDSDDQCCYCVRADCVRNNSKAVLLNLID